MTDEARQPGLDPREVPILPTFTPDIAAALPGPAWLTRRRAAAAEAFAGAPLPVLLNARTSNRYTTAFARFLTTAAGLDTLTERPVIRRDPMTGTTS